MKQTDEIKEFKKCMDKLHRLIVKYYRNHSPQFKTDDDIQYYAAATFGLYWDETDSKIYKIERLVLQPNEEFEYVVDESNFNRFDFNPNLELIKDKE